MTFENKNTILASWLFSCAGMIFIMAVIGAITRLTESGLSMVQWRPLIGALPPMGEEQWQRVFALYQQTPEYQLKNMGMGLAEFKKIFFWEWLHRLWGRLIGLVYALPFIFFTFKGWVKGPLLWKLCGLLCLGGIQGVMGWVMVQSGLIDRPSVSAYRLAAHLGLAFLLFGLLFWVGLSLTSIPKTHAPKLNRKAKAMLILACLTIFYGVLVAGNDAGFAYNTFPTMEGRWIPEEIWTIHPGWKNFFENTAMVQMLHRYLAILTALGIIALGYKAAKTGMVWLGSTLTFAALAQIGLGIATLLTHVHPHIAATHQAGALVVLSLVLAVMYRSRV